MERFRQLYGISLTKQKLHEMVLMLVALETVFAFSYLGYIQYWNVSATSMHVLVIVAAMILGARGSIPVVCVFVGSSMWIGTYATVDLDKLFSPIVSGMPLSSLSLAVARIIFALIVSWMFGVYFRKPRKHVYVGISLIAIAGTLLHGFVIFLSLYLFFPMLRETLTGNILSYPWLRDWVSIALSVVACCAAHYFLSGQKARTYLAYLCDDAGSDSDVDMESRNPRILVFSKVCACIIGILCILYLRKMIFTELGIHGIIISRHLNINLMAFLVQALVAFISLFGIVSIIIQWIYEYYTAQRSIMNRKILEQSVKISIDALTGVSSRFAYNEVLELYSDSVPSDVTVFLMDINGLKVVNDTLGHEAGDELIRGASDCITEAVGDKGQTFRIGGDEFVAIGHMKKIEAQIIIEELGRIVKEWSGDKVKSLSISVGCAFASNYPEYSIEDLTKEADRAMYVQKQEYYRNKIK